RLSSPRSISVRAALGESWMPAPVSSSSSACSSTMTRKPLRASASAAVSPPMPAPATMTVREDIRAGAPARGSSGNVVQGAFRRPSGTRRERRVVAVERRTIGADVLVILPHVAEHVWVIERRLSAYAHEFLGADVDDRNAEVVMEVGNDRVRHCLIGM